ncbi:MAG TPA: glycosyltransferase family 1 protein [Thermoanaerobaculaceae bacterium]|nr:glycosyltransferase family 1 protein [Thermoanaerobaculaceae bacterium]
MAHRLRVTALFFSHLLRDLAGTFWARLRRWHSRVVEGHAPVAIGVDIFPFFERMTGVGWYEWNVLANLPAADPDLELRLYAHTFAAPDEPSPPAMPCGERTRFRYHHIPHGFLLPIGPTLAVLRNTVEPLLMWLDGNDVFFAPNFFVPRRHQAALAALVPTVHDLAFLRLPHTVQQETLDNLHRHLPGALYRADALIAVSAATAADLTELADVSRRRIHVVHEGVDAAFTPDGPRGSGLPDRYLLFVSTLEPRKNVEGMLAGFALAVAAGYPGQLVLVGRWGWRTEGIQQTLATSPVRDRILHLSYLDRSALQAALRGAEALLFPSWLEGFGLPALEAMASGAPVILSSSSSLPEVGGDAALYVDPARPESMASAILQLHADPALRLALAQAGRQRSQRFTWAEAAVATARVLRRAAGLAGQGADEYRV